MILFIFIVGFIGGAVYKKVDIFPTFIEGAKQGFETSIKVIPYLVGMLVAISAFRNSGALTYIVDAFKWIFSLTDSMKTFGADSFVGRLSCVFQACSDTILYVLALYFGSVNIKNTRYTLIAGLLADLAGVITAIIVSYIFFH